MNIRFKVVALLALLFALLSGVAIVIQQQLVMPSFAGLERSNALTSMKRLRYAIDQRLKSLQYNAMDWGNWKESYRFVQDHDPDFIKTNITRESMRELQINVLLMVDRDGRVVLCSCDHLRTALRLPPQMLDGGMLPAQFPWRRLLGTASEPRGLMQTNLGPMLMVGSPILDGTGVGESRGMVIMGRVLMPATLRDLARQTQADVTIVAERPAGPADRVVESDSMTSVYGSFDDVFGRPLMTMRVDLPREITARGRLAIRYASASLVAAAVAVLILLLFILNRVVLEPLTRVTRHAVAIGEGADLSVRLDFASGDEIGRLAREFDRMVERLADTRRQLVDQSFQAGFAEMAKGVMHNLGNAMTPLGVRLAALEKRLHAAPVDDMAMAAAELTQPATGGDGARRGALAEFLELGCRELKAALREADADIAVMQRQTAIMRASLAEQMRSTGGEPVVEAVRLPELLAQSLEIVPDASRQRLDVSTDESLQKVGAVPVARTVLRLVLQNLIINAADAVRDAGKERGVLRVAAEIVRDADREQLHLQCRDDGIGIARDQLERVFEKGFSTKSRDTNHGIGLHWCANAIAALGGRIWAASDGPGRGASLHLLLPLRAHTGAALS